MQDTGIYAIAAVQALPAQCYVPVRVAKVVSMKEQGKLFRQTTMTKMKSDVSQLNRGWDQNSRYGIYLIW